MKTTVDPFVRASKHENFSMDPFKAPLRFYSDRDRDVNLVSDCFGQLVEYRNRKASGLSFDATLPARWITEDELCAHFIKRHYVIPELALFDAPPDSTPIPYIEFLREAVSSAFATTETEQNNLGTNRLRFIIGDPGEGKTAFLSRMIAEVERARQPEEPKVKTDPYKIICVMLNLENYFDRNTYEPLPLNPDFHRYLFDSVKRTADSRLRDDNATIPPDWDALRAGGDPVISIQRLLWMLRRSGYRVALFIDNIDYYATCWERYSFFPEYDKKTEISIDDNLRWLQREITSLHSLGNSGLCIVLAMRVSTYYNVFNGRHGTQTSHFSSLAYRLRSVEQHVVVGSRLALLEDAVQVVGRHRTANSKPLEDFHRSLGRRFADAHLSKDSSSHHSISHPLKIIYTLGQHGHRSLIQFFSTLNFGYEETNIFERFFAHEPMTLLELYYNNNFKKYSQFKKHFPNLFLNDCMVLRDAAFPSAHRPHVHTYWLKFLILSYIARCGHSTLRELLETFSEKERRFIYEEHLVRLVAGSVATSDESACLKIDPEPLQPIEDRSITVTVRGMTLLSDFLGTPMYLSFRYLSAMTDDYLLSYPRDVMKLIFEPKLDSSCLFSLGEDYINQSTDKLRRKARACLRFIGVLRDALHAEVSIGKVPEDQTCRDVVKAINFKAAEESIIESAGAIFSKLRGESIANEVKKELQQLSASRNSHHDLFVEYIKGAHS